MSAIAKRRRPGKTYLNLFLGCVLPCGWTPDNKVRLRGLEYLFSRESLIPIGTLLFICLIGILPGQAQHVSAFIPQPSPQNTPQAIVPLSTPEVQKLIDKGKQEAEAYHWPQALESYQQALTLARSTNDKPGEAKALNSIGNVYANTNQLPKALEFFQQAAPIFRAVGDKVGEAKALNNVGQVYTYTGEPAKALDFCQQALLVSRSADDKSSEANTLNSIGNIYIITGKPTKALEFYQQTLPLFRAIGDKTSEAKSLGNLGRVYSSTGDPAKALGYYQQVLPIFHANRDIVNEAMTFANIGALYADISQPVKALDFHQQALPLERKAGDKAGEATILHNMGNVYSNLGSPVNALNVYRQALRIYQAGKDKDDIAITLNSIGNLYIKTGQYAKALDTYRQTLTVFRALGDKANEAITLNSIGVACNRIGQPAEALNAYQQALSIFRAVGDKADEAATLANIGDFHARHNHSREAESALRQAIAQQERLRHGLGASTEAKIAFTEGHASAYEDYLGLLVQSKRSDDAFALSQETKARALLDLLINGKADLTTRLSDEESKQLATLRALPDTLNQQMIAEGVHNEIGSKKRFAALQVQLRKAERDLTDYTDALYAQHPDIAQARAAHTLTVAEAARLLPPDTALLEYATRQDITLPEGKTRFVLFVVTSDGKVSTHDLPNSRLQINALVSKFHAACADPPKPYQAQAKQLYRLLLAPAAKRLAGKQHWLICPDGALWNLPFAALQDNKGHFVAERHTLTFAYSATGAAAAVAKRIRPRASGSVLALANPDFGGASRFGDDPHLPGQRPIDRPSRPIDRPSRPIDRPSRPIDRPSRPIDRPSRPIDRPSRDLVLQLRGTGIAALPGTQAEANMLHRLYPDAAIYTGIRAQKATFKREAGKYRYLHLASHAFFNDAAPMLSSIFLAAPPKSGPDSKEDGYLSARDLFDMKLNAELVTLSACQTAQGETHGGEGVIGLTWALTVAGVPTQVVSQWSVDDAATADLMAGFYTRLKAGRSKGAALQAAIQAARNTPKRRHPYYWAPFILIGDWR